VREGRWRPFEGKLWAKNKSVEGKEQNRRWEMVSQHTQGDRDRRKCDVSNCRNAVTLCSAAINTKENIQIAKSKK
jgi:hypothetical protein